jgi:hypothetical protein
MIFAGDWLSYPVVSISWKIIAGSFWIINVKDSVKFDSKFFLKFFMLLFRFFYWTEKYESYKDWRSILFKIVTRKAEMIWSKSDQALTNIRSVSCTELFKNQLFESVERKLQVWSES